MILNRVALQRKSTVLVLLVLLIIIGVYSYAVLPRESEPDITIPYVFVSTNYEGVTPEDMEKLITLPLERKLKGLSDVEVIRSTSSEGKSLVAIKFLPSIEIDDALQKVRDKVDQAKQDLPSSLPDDPVITEVNFSDFPVIQVVISGPFSLKRLKVFAEDLQDGIESVPGVLKAEIVGGLEREIHVEFDLDRVRAYNVPFSTLVSAVRDANVNMPGGSMDIGTGKYMVRVPEDYKHPAEIFNIVAFVRDGKPVYLRDLATIRDHYKDPSTISRLNGHPAVTLQVSKRTGENIVRVVNDVKAAVEGMKPILPPNLEISMTSDRSEDVHLLVLDLENNILSGLILVLIVILLFIGGRSAIFVALSIPLSMMITFGLLYFMGITLNMVVLFSLILALGMLVDNGIVIVENIYRHMQNGKTRGQAARDAVDEVAWPVITSTLTTLSAFFPMIFWPGIMGEFMGYLPRTVIMALTASLFVALVINPVLSALFQTAKRSATGDSIDMDNLPLIKRMYRGLLLFALRNRLVIVFFSLVLLVLSVVAFGKWGAGMEFLPETEPKRAFVNITAPIGTNLAASDKLAKQVEKLVNEYVDIRYVITTVGTASGNEIVGGGQGSHLSTVTMDFKPMAERKRLSSEVVSEVRDRLLKLIKGADVQVEKESMGPPTGDPINMEISGPDIRVLGRLAESVRKEIKDIPGLVDLKDNFVKGKPELTVDVDKERAALLGLNTYSIAYTVKTAVGGTKVGVYREGKNEYDIIARLPEKNRRSVEALKRITISGAQGEPIPLTSLAQVRLTSGLGDIKRKDQRRVITVSADVSGVTANEIITEINKRLRTFPFPRGYSYKFTGEQEEQDKAQTFLAQAFVAAIFLIFLVLVTQFNSIVTPFIILTSVVLSLIGVFWGLIITSTPFGVIMTGVGVISLAGVVVNNAIVLIDYFNQLMARGMSATDALVRAGLVRFRPVLLTAITTILGLVPMATAISFDFTNLELDLDSETAQWWGPMAVAVIFGLAVATLLTLVVVPVLCSLAQSLKGKKKPELPELEPAPANEEEPEPARE
jgi:multidrug efflux pump